LAIVRRSVVAALAAGDAAVLGGLRGDAERALRHLPRLAAWFAVDGTDQVAATLAAAALWLAAAWLAVGLLAVVGSRLPGALGRPFAALGAAMLPRALRGVVAGSAGLGLMVAPLAASAAPLSPGPTVPVHASAAPRPLPTPAWPASPSAADPAGRSHQAGGDPTERPPRRRGVSPHAPARPRDARAAEVSVRPGDSLWLLAARRLADDAKPATDRAVAASWPRWYAANRDVIGADPNLLHPGERLDVPAGPAPSAGIHQGGNP
jgi:hypothetical protein